MSQTKRNPEEFIANAVCLSNTGDKNVREVVHDLDINFCTLDNQRYKAYQDEQAQAEKTNA